MNKKIIISGLVLSFLSFSCIDTEINKNQKQPTVVAPSSLFLNGTIELFSLMNSASVNLNVLRLYAQYWAQTTYPRESQYNQVTRNIGQNIWDNLYRDVLIDLKKARDNINKSEHNPMIKNQLAVIDFLSVYSFSTLVDIFGDVPYKESLDPNNPTPVFDDAKTIYLELLDKLDNAIGNMNSDDLGLSEPVYSGNMTKWKKAAASHLLRMALRIADVDISTATKYILKAEKHGLITSNDDNFGINYLSAPPNTNPLWENLVQSGRDDFVPANTLVDKLNELNDPRRRIYFQKHKGKYVGGKYGSANTASSFSALGKILLKPDLKGNIITSAEVHFLLAEAIERGVSVTGSAESHYITAIRESISEWGGTASEIDSYLSQTNVAYSTAKGDWKQKIGTQKWIALFNNGMEGWTTYRIFDQPNLNPLPIKDPEPVPTRFLYPQKLAQLNGKNLKEAISKIGGDTKNTKLFWDKY